ncbi:MAG: S1 RNA-binding domain-containing protein, partial [Firmicutes bacterium]|nr:S1 RNA-binding domain-containing protein [Bacillota bacterium]
LHVSQISRDHVEKPSDILSVGQVIEAKIVDFNGEGRKISLSLKALQPTAAPVEEAPVEEAPVEEAPAEEAPEEAVEAVEEAEEKTEE